MSTSSSSRAPSGIHHNVSHFVSDTMRARLLTNSSTPRNCSDYGLPECEPEIFYVIPMVIITLVIIVGNVLILLIFHRILHKTCLPIGYLANLAVADLGVGVCNAFFGLPLVIQGRWPDNHIYSDIIGYIINTFSALSATTLGVVSFDRYLYVSRPLKYNMIMTKKIKTGILIGLWIISLALGLPGFLGVVHFYYDEHAYISYIHFTDSIIVTLVYCVGILLPVILTMIVCYGKIYVIARRHIRELKELGIEQKSSIHVVTTLVLTVLCFILCWTPYAVHHVSKAITKYDPGVRLLDFSVTWLAAANSGANCVIYWLRQSEVRNEVRSLLCCGKKVPEKAQSDEEAYMAVLNGGPIVASSVSFNGRSRQLSRETEKPDDELLALTGGKGTDSQLNKNTLQV